MSEVQLTGVSRWYGNVVAVNDVTMTLGPGVTGLLGPNGAGKTTLLHMMSGFLAPSQGDVRVDGLPVHMSASDWHIERGGPCLGEHNDMVFGEILGLSPAEIRQLRDDAVI